ncbi:MAG TPA: DinB family protein [Pyrinomonadaceae bacterium]|nr:DinB family protein [Pyrinomonadaceae bacterium]
MIFNSVGEIFDEIDAARDRLVRSVEGLTAEQQNFAPEPGRWSAAEILEHLAATENGVVRLCRATLNKLEGAGKLRAEGQPFAPVTIEEHIERSRRERYKAPEQIAPGGGVPVADSLARLAESRETLRSLRPRIETADCAGTYFPHPAFGPLNLYQWLAFVGAHETRHLAQIEALKEAMQARN